MKNFKKIIIIGVIIIIVIIYAIYKNLSNNQYQEINFEKDEIENKEDTENEKTIDEKNYIVLHITGEVINPGIIKIEEGQRVADAIEAAGGVTPNANVNKINLAYILKDGQKLYVPSIYDEEEKEFITENIGKNILDESIENNNIKININTATESQLENLSGIGPSTAMKIVNYRKENGLFKSIDEIKNVPGIGESKFNAIKDNICV